MVLRAERPSNAAEETEAHERAAALPKHAFCLQGPFWVGWLHTLPWSKCGLCTLQPLLALWGHLGGCGFFLGVSFWELTPAQCSREQTEPPARESEVSALWSLPLRWHLWGMFWGHLRTKVGRHPHSRVVSS